MSVPPEPPEVVEERRLLSALHDLDVERTSSNGHDPPEGLTIHDVADVAARVDAAPAPRFLARPVWPHDGYGILGAESKAGKTWASLDLAHAVASAGAWLGQFPCETPGRALVFLGEGGERKMTRRLRAICEHYGTVLEGLPIRLCFRVPHLTALDHLAIVAAELRDHPPALVVIDPLYLAARGARGSDLYEMGGHLGAAQRLCQDAGAALAVAHHWNKTGGGKGRERFSGAGPAEWGRVTCSIAVEHRHTDDATKASSVVLALAFVGDETPDVTIRMRRRVWTDDPDDLASPMHYDVERLADRADDDSTGDLADEKPAVRRTWAVLARADAPLGVTEVGDRLAEDSTGIPLKRRTVQDALGRLRDLGRAWAEPMPGTTGAYAWRARTPSAHGEYDEGPA